LRALQRTQTTQNVYYNFRSPKATLLYEDIAPTVLVDRPSWNCSCQK